MARDPALSAFKIHPMQRPKLKAIFDAGDDLNVLIYYKQSRFIRNLIPDFSDVVQWAKIHGVQLVSATQNLGDPTDHLGVILPMLTAWMDEGTSRQTQQTLRDLYARTRRSGGWGGGKPPYGYKSIRTGPKQHVLAVDDEAAAVIREAARRITAGESLNSVVADFNRRGITSPYNRSRQLNGRPVGLRADGTPTPWQRWALSIILRSPAMLGYALHHKQLVIGEDGFPVRCAPPLITEQEWEQLQVALGHHEKQTPRRTQTDSLLLQVAFCAMCGSALYRWSTTSRGKKYFNYKCLKIYKKAEFPGACNSLPVNATWLDNLASELFLGAVGHVEIVRRVYHRAPDTERTAMVHRALKTARAEYDAGGYAYPGGEDEYSARMVRLSAELRELTSAAPTGYVDEPTGELFSEAWERLDIKGRRQLMITAGFRIQALRTGSRVGVIHAMDPDLARRAGLAASGRPVPTPADPYGASLPASEIWRRMTEVATDPDRARFVTIVQEDY